MLRIGIDIGGTFTDFVVYDPVDGSIITFKILTDNSNPANTVIQGLKNIIAVDQAQIIHGSTVATNALLERKGVRTALITTRGFKDIIQIGRQNRSNLYKLNITQSADIISSELRLEVDERIDCHGDVITPLAIEQLEEISQVLHKKNIESVAVCLLFSFLYPEHERQIASNLRHKGYFVSASTEILPEYREYERTSTTVVNAYISPILKRYLFILQNTLPKSNLQIMQSNGGMINLSEASQNGARCILSGPAGGIVGAQYVAQTINTDIENYTDNSKIRIITFDMGGTSTDVSLVNEQPSLTTEAIVGGFPIHLPLLDIHTIGAGGGSIAYIDPGGSLCVGPQSASSDPGPACYGRGDLPTVTDANLVLGRILPDYFLGGTMRIYPDRAYSALSKLGCKVNLTPIQAALGIIDVANIQMERAIRVISVERGYDPNDFSLFSFGGAGGLHAAELARQLGIPRVIIPKFASTLSAFGMLASNVIKDYVQTVMYPGTIDQKYIDQYFSPMIKQSILDITKQGIQEEQIDIQCSIDVRYVGQSYELNIPYTRNFVQTFHDRHTIIYGYSYSDKSIEIVNLRVRGIGKVTPIRLKKFKNFTTHTKPAPKKYIKVFTKSRKETLPMFFFDKLLPGMMLQGPAIIVSTDTTIFINLGDLITVDNYQNLLIDIQKHDKV